MFKKHTLTLFSATWEVQLFYILLSIIGVIFFISLGIWQLNRGQEKEQMLSNFSNQQKDTVIKFDTLPKNDITNYLYRNTKVLGLWLKNNHFLQDNVTNNGISGFTVVTPFIVKDTVILVNRGWISKQDYNNQTIHLDNLPITPQHILGLWRKPSKRFTLGDNVIKITTNPNTTIMQRIDLEFISNKLNDTIFPLMLQLDNQSELSFQSVWKPVFGDPNKHHAYALQWFSFAIIIVILFIFLNYRKKDVNH